MLGYRDRYHEIGGKYIQSYFLINYINYKKGGEMKKFLFSFLLFLGLYTNINATTPPDSFMQLPVSWIHPIEGNEWVANNPNTLNVTLAEFIKFGLNPKAVLAWEQLEQDQYILIVTVDDRMTGKRSVNKLLFVKKNTPVRGKPANTERALLSRWVSNGNELTVGNIYSFMLDTCNSIMVLHKSQSRQAAPQTGLPSSVTKYWEGSH